MKNSQLWLRAILTTAILPIGAGSFARAQVTPGAAPATAESIETPEETVVLSPFVVEASEDPDTYQAKATLAGTRIRTELKDVGSSVSVITKQFLTDTASSRSEDLLVYATSTEVAGQGGNFAGGGDNAIVDTTNRDSPVANTRVRGLAEADNLRDFNLTDIPWDSYNVGRVDLQRGPNSILFGIGSPAGIINSSLNQAMFKDAYELEGRYGSFGSVRFSVDANKVILRDELAFRVAAVRDDANYKQEPAFRDDHRVYGTLRWEPKLLAQDRARTTLRVNFEDGKIQSNRPRTTPPYDAITPWFTAMNKRTFDSRQINASDTATIAANSPDAGAASFGSSTYVPWLGSPGQRVWDGVIVAFDGPDATAQSLAFPATGWSYPRGQATTRNANGNSQYRGIQTYDQYAFNARLPGWELRPFKGKSLTDTSIYDFTNNLLDGPNKKEWQDFNALNIDLAQTFMDNRLGFNLTFDKQASQWGHTNYLAGDATQISVDVINTLIDGTPNPNVGRAFVLGSGGSAGSHRGDRDRELVRFAGYGELNFDNVLEGSPRLAKILGRHLFTGALSQQTSDTKNFRWANWFIGPDYGRVPNTAVRQASRDIISFTYLSGSLANRSTAGGLQLPRLTALQAPANTTITQWDTTLGTVGGWRSYNLDVVNANADTYTDATRPYTDASIERDVINSQVAVWQGYLLDNNLVLMAGWRKDMDEATNAGAPSKTGGLVDDVNDPDWRLPANLADATGGRSFASVTGQTRTQSAVLHSPRWVNDRLPWGMALSVHYNRSQNFQPNAARKDILGDSVPSPTGKTKEYGFSVSLFDEKVALKVARYETNVTNASISGQGGWAYLIGAGEAWGRAAAVDYYNAIHQTDQTIGGSGRASTVYGTTTDGHALHWEPSGSAPFTQAAIDAQYAIEVAAVNDFLAHSIPESMQRAWGMNYAQVGGTGSAPDTWSQLQNIDIVGDTSSKGTEYELVATPISGLNVSMNAAKTDAKRINIGQTYRDWIEGRWEDYQGAMGNMRIWGGGNWAIPVGSGGTTRDKFNNEVKPNYDLMLLTNGTNVAELRPWRFNAVASYTFLSEGRLRGLNVGGSYRWQDKVITGYPLLNGEYDVQHPWEGGAEDAIDTWVGYEHKLGEKVRWRIQLNVRNLLGNDDLIPITVQADGSPGSYRIPEPRTWTITNTFSF